MKRTVFSPIQKGFSLVEILVVIAIIAALAGASYPVITNALTKSKIAESQKVASEIVIAINAFEAKHGFIPFPSQSVGISDGNHDSSFSTGGTPGDIEIYTTADAGFLKVLMGKDEDINDTNTKFFEFQATSNKRNGIEFEEDGETPKALYDPWGNPYVIVIDFTGDNTIDFANFPLLEKYQKKGGDALTVYEKAIVLSPGPDKEFNDVKDVKSWK